MSQALGIQHRPLPLTLKMATAVAERIGGPRLQPEPLMEAAARSVGLEPDFPAHVVEALGQICRSIETEANLHWFGATNMRTLLVTGLGSYLRVEHEFAQRPELAETPLRSPLFVVGLPRSGTTYLHRLLSAPEEADCVRMYQHIYPVPFRPFDLRRLKAEVEFFPWKVASSTYGLDAIHFVRPKLADECNFGMRVTGRSMIYWAVSPNHSYLRWLLAQDLKETYAFYRKVLILHQEASPGRRLVLKCPHHLAWLPSLFEAVPEACVVQTHRDPLKTVPSECNLIASLHSVVTEDLDWRRTVESNMFKVHTFARRAVDFADTETGKRILHLPYRELVGDPVGLARTIHEHFELPFSDGHAGTIRDFAEENRQHKHGKHRYSAEQFEIDTDALREDYAPYLERFRDELAPG